MLSTNIDGTPVSGSSQVFDLLSMISNPEIYEKRLKALQDATAENKKYVELVAPASDILALKEKASKDRNEAAIALSAAGDQAKKLVQDANATADDIVKNAKAEADRLVAEAAAINKEAKAKLSDMNAQISAAKNAKEASDAAAKDFAAQTAALAAQSKQFKKTLEDAEAIKQDIIIKHRAFIESLA